MDSLKLEIYLEVLSIFKEDLWDEKWGGIPRPNRFICSELRRALEKRDQTRDALIMYKLIDVPEFFPEFFEFADGLLWLDGYLIRKKESKNELSEHAWWDSTNHEARIRLLEYIIEHRL